jgi:hypothetical protein
MDLVSALMRPWAMSKPLNPCIRVASSDAVSDLRDWLASNDAEAERPEGAKARRLIALACEIKPAQALFLHRVGRTCSGAMRPLSVSGSIGLPFVEFAGSTVHDVVDGLIQSLER